MNQSAPFDRHSVLLALVLLCLICVICGGMGVYVLSDPGIEMSVALVRSLEHIENYYVDSVGREQLVGVARRGMIERLDRFSGYVTSDHFDEMDRQQSGRYSGIGISIVRHEDGLLIMAVREGGPAHEVGLLTGDVILAADSVSLEGLSASEASNHLRGEEGTAVTLTIYRPVPPDTLEVKVTRQDITYQHIPYAGYTPDSLVYIRLLDFDPGASDDLRAALDSLVIAPSSPPRGLILDLRGNPGGLFYEAYRTADLFLDEGTFIVGTNGRSRWHDADFRADGDDVIGGLPMAVLVDGGSASSSEIVAGALQQAGRAILVGDTTFGKGLVQGYVRFADGDGLRLTISRYFLDGEIYLNDFDSTLNEIGHGLVPDNFYRFEEYQDFPLALERSLLLQRFAMLHQEEIVAEVDEGLLDVSWVDRFGRFTEEQELDYRSETMDRVELVEYFAVEDQVSARVSRLVNEVAGLCRRSDRAAHLRFSDYILRRLGQIAYEREFSVYEAYDRIVVPQRPDIDFATRVLLDPTTN